MKKITQDALVMLAVVLGLGGIATLVVYRPQAAKLDQIRTDIATRTLALEEDGRKVQFLPETVRQIELMKSRNKDLDRKLPKRKELGDFLRAISENLSAAQMTNQVIEPGSPMQEEFYYTLPIEMQFKGSYLSLATFLQKIAGMERLARVQKMSISTNPQEDILNITLHMNIYFTES